MEINEENFDVSSCGKNIDIQYFILFVLHKNNDITAEHFLCVFNLIYDFVSHFILSKFLLVIMITSAAKTYFQNLGRVSTINNHF